jgi:hypothetical protein
LSKGLSCAGPSTAPRTDTSCSRRFRTRSVGPEVWRVLARCHDIRNRGEYEGDLYVDERLLTDVNQACKVVAATIDKLPPI